MRFGTPLLLLSPFDERCELLEQHHTNGYSDASLRIIDRHADGIVLDFGAGFRRTELLRPNVVNLDMIQYPTTDIVSNFRRLPFRDAAFDAVVTESVFEHLDDPWHYAGELHRVLKPGGEIHAETNFLFPFHADPNHYYNSTLSGIRRTFRHFDEIEAGVGPAQKTSFAVRSVLGVLRDHLEEAHERAAVEQVLALPLEAIDDRLPDKVHTIIGAGVFFHGHKPTRAEDG